MTTLYLIRHAEAQGNVDRRFQGRSDGKISENGAMQLKYLAARFKKIPLDFIYTSPLTRAVETAEAINGTSELPLILDPLLMEINGGLFEGVKFEELPEKFPDEYALWDEHPDQFTAPRGESMQQVYDRMTHVIRRIVHACNGMTVAVVSHGCALRNYLCAVTGTPFEEIGSTPWCDNTGVSRIDFDNKFEPNIVYLNDTAHLPKEASTFAKQDWVKRNNAKGASKIHIASGQLHVQEDEMFIVEGSLRTPNGEVPVIDTELYITDGHLKLTGADLIVENAFSPHQSQLENTIFIDDEAAPQEEEELELSGDQPGEASAGGTEAAEAAGAEAADGFTETVFAPAANG